MGEYIAPAPVVPDSLRWKPVFRAYPENYDVLTEHGWVNLTHLLGVPETETPEHVGELVPFTSTTRQTPTYGVNDYVWERHQTLKTFPKIATMHPTTGEIFFVQPTQIVRGIYKDRLIRFKMKGVDLFTTQFADLWVKPKYGRTWKYTLADDIMRNNHTSSNYLLINKFAAGVDPITGEISETNKHYGTNRISSEDVDLIDMYGWFNPETYLGTNVKLPGAGGHNIMGTSSGMTALTSAPIKLYPKKHVTRERIYNHYHYSTTDPTTGREIISEITRNEVNVYNFIIPPYHNIILRKSKTDLNPRVPWVGGPLIVGDALDKSEIRMQTLRGLKDNGGSYSPFRPDWRTTPAENLKLKE